jgi:hypothetical protein
MKVIKLLKKEKNKKEKARKKDQVLNFGCT